MGSFGSGCAISASQLLGSGSGCCESKYAGTPVWRRRSALRSMWVICSWSFRWRASELRDGGLVPRDCRGFVQREPGREGAQQKLLAPDCQWDLVVCDEAHKLSATFFGGELPTRARSALAERARLRPSFRT